MGFLKNLWQNPEENKNTNPVSEKSTSTSKSSTPKSLQSTNFDQNQFGANFTPSETPAPIAGEQKKEIIAYFKKVFEENNIPGADYQEFSVALEKMKALPMDEQTKFKTLFMSFESMGLTPEKLIETAEFYKTLFSNKLGQFDKEHEQAFNREVGLRQNQVQELTQKNTDIDVEMRKLNDQKIANEQSVKTINEAIQKSSTMLTNSKNDWHATHAEIVAVIDHNIELVKKHLITTPQ